MLLEAIFGSFGLWDLASERSDELLFSFDFFSEFDECEEFELLETLFSRDVTEEI